MIDSKHYGPVLVTLLLLIIGVPLMSSSGITGYATDVGGVEISTTTSFLLGILVVCGLLLLFYGKNNSNIRFSTRRKKNFKLAYKPHSDLDRLKLYIKSRLNARESNEHIRKTLERVGWDQGSINHAFNTLDTVKPIKYKNSILKKLKHKGKNARAK